MCLFKNVYGAFRAALLVFFLLLSFFSFAVKPTNQTLVMVGGELAMCSSANSQHCTSEEGISGKQSRLFKITREAIKTVNQSWPTNNKANKKAVNTLLNTLVDTHSKSMRKTQLLWAWRDTNNELLSVLHVSEFNYVLDMLEIAVVDQQQNRVKERVFPAYNVESSSTDILDFVAASIKVNSQTPKVLVITASSRDPYASADYYESLLNHKGIQAEWLPLTPASAYALVNNKCNELNTLRQTEMHLFNREKVYRDRTDTELAFCQQGINALHKQLNTATAVIFNDGDQALAQQVLFTRSGEPYPWFTKLQSRPVIMGVGSGSILQNGGVSAQGKKSVMVLQGDSLSALRQGGTNYDCIGCEMKEASDVLVYSTKSGLATFDYGTVDSHFSERNRTMRLARLLADTGQKYGFGIDETTALVSIRSADTALMTVIGKNGVVHIESAGKQSGKLSYWPAGAVIDVTDKGFSFAKRSVDNALPSMTIPPLPLQRFGGIFSEAKLRSLLQAMCLTQEQQAVAQQDEFLLNLDATEQTHYYRINKSRSGCGVENLSFKVKTFN